MYWKLVLLQRSVLLRRSKRNKALFLKKERLCRKNGARVHGCSVSRDDSIQSTRRKSEQSSHLDSLWKEAVGSELSPCICCKGTGVRECKLCDGTGDALYCSLEGCSKCPVCNSEGSLRCSNCSETGFCASCSDEECPLIS